MNAPVAGKLLAASGVAAFLGAGMWAFKSVVILITGDQPDYWFELALLWFGLSLLLLVQGLPREALRAPRLTRWLAWVAALTGIAAAVFYIVDGDDEGLFGPAALATNISTIVVLFLLGSVVRRGRLLGRYSMGVLLLAWTYVVALPVGAVLAGLAGERYLEVGLMAIAMGWVVVAAATVTRARQLG